MWSQNYSRKHLRRHLVNPSSQSLNKPTRASPLRPLAALAQIPISSVGTRQRIWLHSKVTHNRTFMFTQNHSQHEKERMLCLRLGTQPRGQIEPSIAHFLPTNWECGVACTG